MVSGGLSRHARWEGQGATAGMKGMKGMRDMWVICVMRAWPERTASYSFDKAGEPRYIGISGTNNEGSGRQEPTQTLER